MPIVQCGLVLMSSAKTTFFKHFYKVFDYIEKIICRIISFGVFVFFFFSYLDFQINSIAFFSVSLSLFLVSKSKNLI